MNPFAGRTLFRFVGLVVSLSVALPAVASVAADGVRGVETYRPYFEVTQGLVSADFRATPLKQVLKMVAAQAGVDLYLDKAVQGTVTARFRGLPLGKALKRMLRQQSFILTYDEASKPAELWLIKEGLSGFEVISGYRGDTRRDHSAANQASGKTSVQQTMRENHLPAALGVVQLHGAMGPSYWRNQMARNHTAVTQSAWRYTAIRQTIQLKREVLHRALATAPPSQRPEIAQQMVALAKQEQSVVVGARSQQLQAVKDAQKLASLRTTAQLPTQQIAQQKVLQQRQLVMLRQQQQQQMRTRVVRHDGIFGGNLLSSTLPQQTQHRWIVR